MSGSLSILIPTLNEAAGIVGTLEKIRIDKLRAAGYDTEIIVVDGGSTDGTVEIAEKLGAIVVIERRLGYGRAYKTAFRHARGDVIVTLDGDGSYPAELIPKLVKFLSNNKLDFISTSRFSPSQPINIPLLNRIGNWILSLTTRILFNTKLKDSQSGMWIFRKAIIKNITPISDGMSFSEEIKIRALLSLRNVSEVPIPYKRRMGSQKLRTFSDGFRNMLHLFRLFKILKVARRQGSI